MAVSRREAFALLGTTIGVGALAACSSPQTDQKASASPAASETSPNTGTDPRFEQAKHNVRYDSGARDPFVLLHVSDFHGDGEALGRVMSWAKAHDGMFDDILATGDLTSLVFSDGMGHWDKVDGAGRVLTCIGNHDVFDVMEPTPQPYDKVSVSEAAARYVDAYAGSWGTIDHAKGTTWYAKDYAERGIRLVVLDCMLYPGIHSEKEAAEQDAWLEAILADAAKQGLTVVVAEHFPLTKESTVDCSWAPFDRTIAGKGILDARVTDRVQAFIDAGGSFACYLCGHTHADAAHTLDGRPEQFALAVPCATAVPDQIKWGDMDRSQEATRDAYNVVFVDTVNKLVKVVRVGADRDLALQHRGTLCWNYGAHRLVHAD